MSTKLKVRRKTVALNLHKQTPTQIVAQSNHFVTSMTGKAHFPNPNPALATISAQALALDAAFANSLSRTKGTVGKMHLALKTLSISLKGLAAYVETIANADPDNASIIITEAGMTEKKPIIHQAKTFSVVPGKVQGTAIINIKAVPASSYSYQMTIDPNLSTSWVTIYAATRVKYVKEGLTSGTRYYFRAAVSTKGKQGNWGNVLNILVN
jgi:hypothetical protein